VELHGDDLSGSTDEPAHFNIRLSGFSANTPSDADDLDLADLDSFAILDSGSTICLMPDAQVRQIHDEFDVVSIDGVLAPFADCAWRGSRGDGYSFDFEFGDKTIRVPLREMVVNAFDDVQDQIMADPSTRRLFGDWEGVCIFGIGSTANFGFEDDQFTLLGDTFLRSAYVVYDLANDQLGLAQANLDSDDSDIVEIEAGSSLPSVRGVEGQSQRPNPTDDNDDNRQSADGRATLTVTVVNRPTGETTDDDEDEDDAAIILSNPFRGGIPAAATFMGLMGALMLAL
jgi:hypothetical protein